LKGTGFVQDFC